MRPALNLSGWRALDNRHLLALLALLVAGYLILLSWLTQPPDEAINVLLVIGGAMLMGDPPPSNWQPKPDRLSRWTGVALLVLVVLRGQPMMAFDFASSLLPLLAGVGLALLAAPVRQLGRFRRAFAVLALLPVMRAVGWLLPLGPLSLLTAWLTELLLRLCGYPVLRAGTSLRIPGGAVGVAGPCAGLNMLLQLLVVALIFTMAFPMRHRWQNGLMLLVALLVSVLVNGMRIAVLALINASDMPNKTWWFDFFHWHWGSLIFAAIAMQVFVWLYGYWLARQVAALKSR